MMLSGIVLLKKVLHTMMLNDDTASGRISAQMVLRRLRMLATTT